MPDFPHWHSRGYLPHYDDGKKLQSITYRLADALPRDVLAKIEEQALDDEKRRIALEQYLDAGYGSCLLRDSRCAEIVLENWHHFAGTRYHLHAWVVMPNHVHILLEPLGGAAIGDIVQSWKSYTAKAILRAHPSALKMAVDAAGPHVWQEDYLDRFIRNERHYLAAVEYIHNNSVKAGLVAKSEDWPWSSAREDRGDTKWEEK